MRGVIILVITFTFTQLVGGRSHYQGQVQMVVESWGDEFCRPSLCALMSSNRWGQCCQHHGHCCAYVSLLNPKGPFSYEEDNGAARSSSSSSSSSDEAPNPDQSEESPQEPPALQTNSSQSPPNRFDKMQEDPALESQPQAQPQRQPRPSQPRFSHPQSFSRVRPLQDMAFSQPVRTYNEVLEEENRKVCRPRFCSLLDPRKQNLCCNKFKQCCVYVTINHYPDPFYFEKEAVNPRTTPGPPQDPISLPGP